MILFKLDRNYVAASSFRFSEDEVENEVNYNKIVNSVPVFFLILLKCLCMISK